MGFLSTMGLLKMSPLMDVRRVGSFTPLSGFVMTDHIIDPDCRFILVR